VTTLRITAGPDSGARIDIWLASAVIAEGFDFSRSFIRKLIDEHRVLIDGKAVKPSHRPNPGDTVELLIPAPIPSDIPPMPIPLDIMYEDGDIIVINKPQGMVVHPAPGHYTGTLVNALLRHCGGELSGINGILRPGIVHRIDRDTSGLLAVAKNDASHRSLAAQLAARSVERRYVAVCSGRFKSAVTVSQPIARHKTHRKKMAVEPCGREAITHFKPIEVFGNASYIEARLETGRTHQIRVHLAHLKHPILGDKVYGPENQPFAGQMLHAGVLGFVHPSTNEKMIFETPPHDYFQALLNRLRN